MTSHGPDLGGQVALVSGAAHGIGAGIARAFAAAGAAVVAADIDGPGASTLADELQGAGARSVAVPVDVADPEQVGMLVERTLAAFAHVDILVNNAGVKTNSPGSSAEVLEMPLTLWQRTLAVNLTGPFLVTQAVARAMIRRGQGGKVINITSGAARSARRSAAHYCSSKAGLSMLTRVLAIELAPHRINVNAVAPGLVLLEDPAASPARQAYLEAMLKSIPAGRFGTPDDVAAAVLFFASPAADYITGEEIHVSGGSQAGRTHLPRSSQ